MIELDPFEIKCSDLRLIRPPGRDGWTRELRSVIENLDGDILTELGVDSIGDIVQVPLVEDMAQFTPEKDYSVYAFSCWPRYEDMKSKSVEEFGYIPSWLYKANSMDCRVYVGYTRDFNNRIQQHMNGDRNASLFTRMFRPIGSGEVIYVDTKEQAKSLERFIAKTIRKECDCFVPMVEYNQF